MLRKGKQLLVIQRAFTILELLSVFVLLGIIISLAIPVFAQLVETYQLEAAQQQVFYHMRLAKMQAAKTEELVRVSFEFYGDKNVYKIVLSDQETIYEKLPDNTKFYAIATGNSSTNPEIVFQPNGVPWGGATIGIKNIRGDTRYVIIAAVTGRIRNSTSPPLY